MTSAPSFALNLSYFFPETDISQGGINSRIALDFAYLRSAIPLTRIDVFLLDAQDNYVSQLFNVPQQNSPFSLEFPFESFFPRGGGAGQLDPTRIRSVYLSVSPVISTSIDQIDLSTAIERVRFSGTIPEPGTGCLACLAALAPFAFLFHERKA